MNSLRTYESFGVDAHELCPKLSQNIEAAPQPLSVCLGCPYFSSMSCQFNTKNRAYSVNGIFL